MGLVARIKAGLLLLVGVVFIGIIGYKILGGKDWSILDSIYMTVITLSTVGFEEVVDISHNPPAKVFTIFLIILGMGTLTFVVSSITAFIVEGELTNILWRRKMDKEISELKDHFIICGGGETGFHVIEELLKTGRKFVLIEPDPERIKKAQSLDKLYFIEGDATDEQTLLQAGILRAKGLVTTLPTDRDNLFVAMTARELNPHIRIVAKEIDSKSAKKLFKAGANAVVSPTFIGGLRLVSELVRPTVVSFLDKMLRDEKGSMRVEEVTIGSNSSLINKDLVQAEIPKITGALIMAIKEPHKKDFIYNPKPSTILKKGDILVVLADAEMLEKLRPLVEG